MFLISANGSVLKVSKPRGAFTISKKVTATYLRIFQHKIFCTTGNTEVIKYYLHSYALADILITNCTFKYDLIRVLYPQALVIVSPF